MKTSLLQGLQRCLFALVLFAAPASVALANVHVSILRLSDTSGILTATGSVPNAPTPANDHLLVMDDPFAVDPTGNSNAFVSSTLNYGGNPINFIYDAAASYNIVGNGDPGLYFGFLGSPLGSFDSGALTFNLTGGATLAAVGSTGALNWGAFGDAVAAGDWVMTGVAPVPEPETYAMMLAGLGLLAWTGRRRKLKAA